jgi:hypothetical protein
MANQTQSWTSASGEGALVDEFRLKHGFWEAKDSHDDLGKEVKKKLAAGFEPRT